MSERKGTTRRDALAAAGALASAFATAGVVLAHGSKTLPRAAKGAKATKGAPLPAADVAELESAASLAAVSELLGEVKVGTRLARCRVVEVLPMRFGAIPLRMETPDGARFQLDVLKRGDGREGVGRAPGLAIFVTNGGDGSKRTDETQGLAAMALGDALTKRIREGATVPSLLTFAEREARWPSGQFVV